MAHLEMRGRQGFTQSLKALVYDVLPPATAITEHDIGLDKLSANGQCHVGAQLAVRLLHVYNSNYFRRFFYNCPHCLRQHKSDQNRLNRDGSPF